MSKQLKPAKQVYKDDEILPSWRPYLANLLDNFPGLAQIYDSAAKKSIPVPGVVQLASPQVVSRWISKLRRYTWLTPWGLYRPLKK
ncbi:MAG: hypothetical protein U9Q70_07340, partial [Chloroflexota bacterium]|nr:hypothetical protein [Chloroflexota bacterium]